MRKPKVMNKNVLGESTTKRIQNLIASYLIDTQDIDSICLFDVKKIIRYAMETRTVRGYMELGGVHGEISLNDWYQKERKGEWKSSIFLATMS
ncbi:hypothetical protein GCM10020331_088080 [Ectobacillus funiculus]